MPPSSSKRLAIGLGVSIVAIFATAMVMLSTDDEEPSRQFEPITAVSRPPREAAVVVPGDAAVDAAADAAPVVP